MLVGAVLQPQSQLKKKKERTVKQDQKVLVLQVEQKVQRKERKARAKLMQLVNGGKRTDQKSLKESESETVKAASMRMEKKMMTMTKTAMGVSERMVNKEKEAKTAKRKKNSRLTTSKK